MRLLQINEEDLAELEATLPKLMLMRPELTTAREKTQWRRVQEIVTRVRWEYGPWLECERLDEMEDV